jgi:hypothetical protein
MRSRLVAGSLLLGWLVMTGCTMTPIPPTYTPEERAGIMVTRRL